jgi:hypothetical protein
MRLVRWTDDKGYDHLSLLRDGDPDRMAPQGIPADPPSLDLLDWESIKRELHNELVSRELVDWKAVQRSGEGVTAAILAVMRRKVVLLYRLRTTEEYHAGN